MAYPESVCLCVCLCFLSLAHPIELITLSQLVEKTLYPIVFLHSTQSCFFFFLPAAKVGLGFLSINGNLCEIQALHLPGWSGLVIKDV